MSQCISPVQLFYANKKWTKKQHTLHVHLHEILGTRLVIERG
jgi:hypothetical protein